MFPNSAATRRSRPACRKPGRPAIAAPSSAANSPGEATSLDRSCPLTGWSSSPAGMTAASSTARSTRNSPPSRRISPCCATSAPRSSSMPTPRAAVMTASSRRSRSGRASPMTNGPAYGKKLTELADRMADFGVGMAFHHHMGTIVETDDEVDRLMAATGKSVGLLFDTGHCLFSGGDPASLLNRHLDRIVHFHCKDVRAAVLEKARRQDMSFMAAVMEGHFHRARRRFRRFPVAAAATRQTRLRRLDRRRGRTGSGQGASA